GVGRPGTRVGVIAGGSLVKVAGVHDLEDMKRYEITILFAQRVPVEAFAQLEGVTDVETLNDGRAVRLAMQGSADAVIKAAAHYPVISLTSYEPSLEDRFLRYHEGDGRPAK